MKNPLYPYNIINDETINNYNRCIIMTLENNLVYVSYNSFILGFLIYFIALGGK